MIPSFIRIDIYFVHEVFTMIPSFIRIDIYFVHEVLKWTFLVFEIWWKIVLFIFIDWYETTFPFTTSGIWTSNILVNVE